jgi:hypothetical protein
MRAEPLNLLIPFENTHTLVFLYASPAAAAAGLTTRRVGEVYSSNFVSRAASHARKPIQTAVQTQKKHKN